MVKDQGKFSAGSDTHLVQEMSNLFQQSGIVLNSHQLEQMLLYHTMIRRHNPQLDLTRIHSFGNMVLKLYVDSILPGKLVALPSPLLDLGTGPGMPGIPLKIAFPHLEVLLAESRGKRVSFLKMVVNELGLDRVSVIGRSISPGFNRPVAGVITRAVEGMEKTLGRVSGCLETGGWVIFMKGPGCDEEIDSAVRETRGRYRLIKNLEYRIPHSPHERRLVVFERTDLPPWEEKERAMKKFTFHAIESEQNNIFKELKKLLTTRGIRKQGSALLSGPKPVMEALQAFPERCDAWITRQDQSPPPDTSNKMFPHQVAPFQMSWYQLAPALFQTLDLFGTDSPLLRIKIPAISKWDPREGFPEGCSILVPFQDPENVGAVIRSAVAFGAKKIILLAESAHPYHPKALRASGGAVLWAPLFEGPSLGDLPGDLPIVALSPEGRDISRYGFPSAFAILPGMEGPGLPEHFRQSAYAIPIRREVESLNAATATAIVLYLWAQENAIIPR